MKKSFVWGLLLLVIMLLPIDASAYPTGYTAGSGYQDFSYVGLGNANEVVAFAEY